MFLTRWAIMGDRTDLVLHEFSAFARKFVAEVLAEPHRLPALIEKRVLSGEGAIYGYVPTDVFDNESTNYHWSLAANRESRDITGYQGRRQRLSAVFAKLLAQNERRLSLYSDITLATDEYRERFLRENDDASLLAFANEYHRCVCATEAEPPDYLRARIEDALSTGQLWHSMFLVTEPHATISCNKPQTHIGVEGLQDLAGGAVVTAVQAWDGDEFLYWVPSQYQIEVKSALEHGLREVA